MNENPKPAIFSFIDWYKPAFKAGGPVRSMVNLAELLGEYADLFVMCGNKEIDGTMQDVENNQWIEQDSGEQVMYCPKPKKSIIRDWILQFPEGVFHVNGIYSPKFSILPLFILRTYFPSKKVVVSPRGMLNEGALEIKSVKKLIFIVFTRGLGLFDKVVWHATSQEEENRIKKFFPQAKQIYVLSNIPLSPSKLKNRPEKIQGELKMYSVTRIVPIKKLEVLLQSLQEYPIDAHITFDIYGPIEDKEYAEELNRLAKQIPNLYFNLKGAVAPDELNDIHAQYHLFCLPSANENFGHSIYEAFARACPVLISDQTPWRKLETENAGFDIALDNKSAFSEKLSLFAQMNQEEWECWSEGAFAFAQKHYNKEEWINSYLTLFAPNDSK